MNKLSGLLVVFCILSGCSDDGPDFLPTAEERLELNQMEIDAWLEENNITASIDAESGLRHLIREQGSGATATVEDTIVVSFIGVVLDGPPIDSADSVALPLFQLIEGWRIGVPLIQEGGSITLYIPSVYAWDLLGTPGGSVQPGDNVIFDIDLIDVID